MQAYRTCSYQPIKVMIPFQTIKVIIILRCPQTIQKLQVKIELKLQRR